MKRKLLVAVPLLIVVALLAWIFRPKHETLGEAYISDRSVTLWSSVAQVREPLDSLHYGDRVDIVARRNENVKIRTASGAVGWVDARLLMETALWQRSARLLTQARTMPVQARGRTKVSTNLRVEPGRTQPRLYQFPRGTAVEVVSRAVADWTSQVDEKDSSNESQQAKKEDWLLVRGLASFPPGENASRNSDTTTATQPNDQTISIAGWIIGRFVELDLPNPVREGTASANVRPAAWFELNRVADPAGDKAQYLVAGSRGPEGQVCDFTSLRVYTWDRRKNRYETAFIENNLCGQMPIRINKGPKSEPEFRFRVKDQNREEHVYHLVQTVVRRVRETGDAGKSPKTSKAPKKSR
ncbi:MAG TPA: SH3 domain-containing protein [Candidatus Dormibacteraeota bacterium]|nr:SH3 domain-containing protein [Candidatus Dormibacteraeota bacterium]